MPSTLPATPSIFQVLVTAFLDVFSTIDTVLSPVEGCDLERPAPRRSRFRTAADAARMVPDVHGTLPLENHCRSMATIWEYGPVSAGWMPQRGHKRIVSGVHPNLTAVPR